MHKNYYWFSDFVPKEEGGLNVCGLQLGEVQMKEVAPAARKRDARLSFAFVHPGR